MFLNSAPTFSPANGTGKLIVSLGSGDDTRSVTIQPDGKIVLAGTTDGRFSLVRLNVNGSLDAGFSEDGKLVLSAIGFADRGSSATLQADGKIVVAGYSSGDFAVARLDADGNLDTTFNGTGKLLVPVGEGRPDYGLSVTQQPDGKILVSGYTTGGSQVLSMIRLSADGSLDTSFNETGKLLLQVGVTNDVGHSVVAQADGKILVGGYSLNSAGNYDFSLVRLNADGTLDTTLNGTGKLLVPVGTGLDLGHSLVIQPDGKMVLAGYSWNGSDNDFSLVRLNANGTLDATFNGTGKLLLSLGGGDDAGYSVALQPDGKMVLAGHSFNGSNYDFSLARLNANGSLDTTFNGTGKLLLPVGSSDDRGYSVAIQPDGKIVVAGTSNNDFSVVRLNADGSLDTEFNGIAIRTLDDTVGYTENSAAVALDTAVAIYDANLATLAGGAGDYAGSSVTLARRGGASGDDVFSSRGNLTLTAGNVVLSGVTVGAYSNAAGTFTITFNNEATQARVNEALSSIAYANSSEAPPATVEILWIFNDGNAGNQGTGGALTASGTTLVFITSLNDSPSGNVTISGTAEEGETLTASNTLADADGLGTIGYQWRADGTDIAGATTATLLLDQAQVGKAITVVASYTDGGGTGESVASEATAVVTNTNDPPVLDPSGSPSLPTILENATSPSGSTIAALVIDGSITDPDGPAMEAIALEAVDTSLGTWQYSLTGGATWLTINAQLLNSSTNTLGLLLGPTDMLRLLPFGDLNGTLANAITFRAWDMSSGSAGEYVVTTPGTGAFSSASDTASLTVSAVNDAPTFAAGTGKLIQPVGSSSDLGYSVAVQPDGKILIAGESWSGSSYDFGLIRLNRDGTLDNTFSTDGKLLVPVGTGTDQARSVIVQPDGKILVAGYSASGSASNFGLIRLNADGGLDTGFGTNGKLAVPMTSSDDRGFSVTLQPDGKIVVADSSSDSGSNDFAAVRYSADGTLDVAFDGDGKLLTDFGSGTNDLGYSIAMQPDGKIVVAGHSDSGGSTKFAVARYNADGSLDSSFGGDGTVVGASGIGQSVIVQADGKILVAGRSSNGSNWDFGLLRLNENGTPDSSFDGDGTVLMPVGSNTDEAFSVISQPDGKIVVAGFSLIDGNNEFSLIRLNANGSLDTSFDADGKVVMPVGSDTDIGFSVTLQPDGKILVAGYSWNGGGFDFSVVRLNADGRLDITFNGAGSGTLGGAAAYTENAAVVPLDSNVLIFDAELAALGGGAGNYDGANITLSRTGGANAQDVFSAVGSLTFTAGTAVLSGVTVGSVSNSGGQLTIAFNANATQARVNEVLSSIGYANSSDVPPSSVQISWTFSDGNSGSQGVGGTLAATGITTVSITNTNDPPVLDPSGSPSLPTILENATSPSGIAIAALVIDGSITDPDGPAMEAIALEAVDTSLGTWQYSLTGGATWLTINAQLLNSSTNTLGLLLGPTDMLRLLPFGDLNGTLANAITFRAWDMSSGSAGEYVVTTPGTGAFSSASDTASLTVSAVNDAPTFAAGTGKLIQPVGSSQDHGQSVIVQDDGRVVVAGYSWNGSNLDFSLIRLNRDGSLDTSFDADGKLLVPVGAREDYGFGLGLQSDGKILMSGYSLLVSNWDTSLIRLNPNGSLDTSFDGDGRVLVNVGVGDSIGTRITPQADGKIVVTGYGLSASGNYDFSIVRLNANGSLDTSFDSDGKLLMPVGSSDDLSWSVAVQADGKILVAGSSNNDFSVLRLNVDGSLDPTFDGDGKLLVPVGGSVDSGYSLVVQPDGKILVAGHSFNGSNYDFSLVRLNADGSLDTGFDGDGKLLVPVGSGDDMGYSATVQPDGKILVAGRSFNGTNDDFSLIRLNANGSLDTSFDGDGKLVVPLGSGDDNAYGVTLQADGKILVAGNSDNEDFSLIRLNPDGSLDTSFGGTAVNTLGGSVAYNENGAAIALDSSVVIIDADLAALAGGAGSYAGASISLSRSGGVNAQDLFSGAGSLTFTAGNAMLSGVTVGTVSNSGGLLTIAFNANATQARVNELLSSIGYANSSDAPPASVQIAWTFSDGNSGSQGSGAALTAAGITTVNITAVNDPPTGSVTISGTAARGETLTASNTLADAEGLGAISYQWKADGTNIAGATASTLLLGNAEVGKSITVAAGYTDLGGTAESVTSPATAPVAQTSQNLGTGGPGNDTLQSGAGVMTLAGGLGDDTYIVNTNGVTVIEYVNEGTDSVRSSVGFVLPMNVENLTLTGSVRGNATGNNLDNILIGNSAVNELTGGEGADTLSGGFDKDKFLFKSVADSPATTGAWDVITDFTGGVDKIDLSLIDLNPTANGRQKFTFVGPAAFTSSGQLRFDAGTQMLYGNTDSDVSTIEFAVRLTGVTSLSAGDLSL